MKTLALIILTTGALLFTKITLAVTLPGPVVETDWLAKNQKDVMILEVREDVKSFTSKPVFSKDNKTGKLTLKKVAGHIPDSVLVDFKGLRSNKKIDGLSVQKMMVGKSSFEKLMQASGVNQDSTIVIVSKGESSADLTMATRFYWQMKYYGHDNMAILNGGMAQWLADGRKLSIKAHNIKSGNWIATAERNEILATSQDVEAAVKAKEQLVDSRDLNLYFGTYYKKSYVYDSGHIPGAKLYPHELLSSKMPAKFLKVSDSKTLLKQMGVDPDKKSITYCNSGHLASGGWFLMSEILGNKNVKLYDGSMHEWTLEKRPVVKMKME